MAVGARAGLVSRNGIATPLVASMKSSSVSVSRSLLRRAADSAGLLRPTAEEPTEQVADVGATGLTRGVEQVAEVEFGTAACRIAGNRRRRC